MIQNCNTIWEAEHPVRDLEKSRRKQHITFQETLITFLESFPTSQRTSKARFLIHWSLFLKEVLEGNLLTAKLDPFIFNFLGAVGKRKVLIEYRNRSCRAFVTTLSSFSFCYFPPRPPCSSSALLLLPPPLSSSFSSFFVFCFLFFIFTGSLKVTILLTFLPLPPFGHCTALGHAPE